ncbi:MAG: hypothetical protein AAF497_16180 [Planctomycetota bacterium]
MPARDVVDSSAQTDNKESSLRLQAKIELGFSIRFSQVARKGQRSMVLVADPVDEVANPYAAPALDAEVRPTVSTHLPLSTYFYSAVVFFVGAFGGGFASTALLIPILHVVDAPPVAIFLVPTVAVFAGLRASRAMYRRLVDLHQRKVAWEIERAERIAEYY